MHLELKLATCSEFKLGRATPMKRWRQGATKMDPFSLINLGPNQDITWQVQGRFNSTSHGSNDKYPSSTDESEGEDAKSEIVGSYRETELTSNTFIR